MKLTRDHGASLAAMHLRIGHEARQIDDRELRHETFTLRRIGLDQQMLNEKRVPRKFGDDAHADAMVGSAPPNRSCT